MEGSDRPNLAPDRAVTLAAPGRSKATALIGFVGEATSSETVRLYQSLTLDRWLEIAAADVVDRAAADGSEDVTLGESVVWVGRDAEIVSVGSGPLSGFEGPGGEVGFGGDIGYRYPRR